MNDDPNWDEIVKQHDELEARATAFRLEPYSFTRVCGVYVIRCRDRKLRDKFTWPDSSMLDVSLCLGSRGLIASLDLGDSKGTILMATSQSQRDRVCQEQSASVEEEDSDTIDSDEVEVKLAEACTSLLAHRRKTARPVGSAECLRRVFVIYRRRELEPCYFEDGETVGENYGWIDFRDNQCLGFKAVLDLPMIGGSRRVVFDGYKVSHESAEDAEPWADYATKHITDRRM